MPLTGFEVMKGIKQIADYGGKLGGAALKGGAAIPALAVTLTMELKEYVDGKVKAEVERIRKKEQCNHITYIDGSGPPTTDMRNHVFKFGGTAWYTNSLRSLYLYHTQDDFLPTDFVQIYRRNSAGEVVKFVPEKDARPSICLKCKQEADLAAARSGR
ncbi:hypothetical protein JMJ55_25145 [Belnapia sp. T6]|uniref:Uncharacterized protein n=1 Tax=Belnapia mucosa TaxID=2804532 RepID=A0ABS1VAG0_9PROT|nr:hypothetical protein [Belnapia mucosa]MBL6458630.1 hypothetical protein [Belnapia mucosa]